MTKGNEIAEGLEDVQFDIIKEAFYNELTGFEEPPFLSRLSFGPLIEYWESKVSSAKISEAILAREILKEVKKYPELRAPLDDSINLEKYHQVIDLLMVGLFPAAIKEGMAMATNPFNLFGFFMTDKMKELVTSGAIRFSSTQSMEMKRAMGIAQACSYILNKFYGQSIQVDQPMVFTIRPEGCRVERHYKAQLNLDFVEIVAKKEPLQLTQKEINLLLSNVYDTKRWLEMIPPDNFEFQGVVRVNLLDVTEDESISRLKYKLLERDAVVVPGNIAELEQHLRNFFAADELRVGLTAIDYPMESSVAHKYKIRHDFLADIQPNLLAPDNAGSIYEKVCKYKDTLIVEDLVNVVNATPIEVDLLNNGIRSIIVAPLTNERREIIGLLELGSKKPDRFNSFSLMKMKELIPLFCIAVERSREEIENQIQAIIQEEYTAIHPSVEWKFIETSFKLLEKREKEGDQAVVDPIVFNEVYPLYGQADIVGSSTIRNDAIQRDLIENLQALEEVLTKSLKIIDFPLVDQYLSRTAKEIKKLEKGITSEDESRVMEFIREEVHPILDQIRLRDPDINNAIEKYLNQLDPSFGIIYRKRKAYEDSVTLINDHIAKILDEEDRRAQEMLPHYFQKYKTDGVEYDIYLGQSMLHHDIFSNIQLRNLRLWQLTTMVRITRDMEELKKSLPVPLSTAQLIFVYGSPLSIRFRMDEKQFDVDGAYNVRYEIIKKRVDKAMVDGLEERLTLPGKIAIVYTGQREKTEYLQYTEYLIDQGFIHPNVEDLSLSKLQGVDGLKALRITVKPHSGK